MGLKKLTKPKATRVIGIDASTNSIAFAVFDGKTPVTCGEVKLNGATVFERVEDAKAKTRALVESGVLKGDYVGIEAAIMVRNIETAIDLAYVYGAIIGELMVGSPQVHKIYPITWQSGIGVPNLTPTERNEIQQQNPNHKPSWYKARGREIRKQRILDVARNHFTIASGSDNVGDAVGIALYIADNLVRAN